MDSPFVWIAAIAIIAVVAFLIFRKKPAALVEPGPTAKASARPGTSDATKVAPSRGEAGEKKPEAAAAGANDREARRAPRGEAAKAPTPEEKAPAKERDVAAVRKGLAATRGGLIAKLSALFGGKKEIDPAILEQIEEVMLSSDVGVKTTQAILGRLRERLQKNDLANGDAVWAALRSEAARILSLDGGGLQLRAKPTVVLMVGVNGVGKTTTIGKLATKFHSDNTKVMLGAGDTFRAAAVQQLEVWGKRVHAEVVRGKDGADPAAVAFDAATKAKEAGVDLVLIDTAGRLHTKSPLMDEIKKVRRSIGKALEGAPHETWLVLDATTGQNALTQAAMFKEAVELTGIILTKLDGTAKGGIVLGICDELKVPVRYIGLGERAEDLREFDADEFVEALFGKAEEAAAAA